MDTLDALLKKLRGPAETLLTAATGSTPAEAAPLSPKAAQAALKALNEKLAGRTRPGYTTHQAEDFINVESTPRRRGGFSSEPGDTGSPGRPGTTATRDPEANRIAGQYARELNLPPPDLQAVQGQTSSLAKQSSIAAAAEEAQRGGRRYQSAVYEGYGRQLPELVDLTQARNYDDLLRAVYAQANRETGAQFDLLGPQAGLRLRFHQGAGEYPSSRAMIEDVTRNRNLNVFLGGEQHPQMSAVDPRSGRSANERFRAVHDYFGHAWPGAQFGPRGEEMAYTAHSQLYSPVARPALAAETRGQNSMVNYGPLNAQFHARRAAGEPVNFAREFQFAPNRGFLLPPEMIDPAYKGVIPDYVRAAINPQHPTSSGDLFHWSKGELSQTDPARYGTGIKGQEARRFAETENPRVPRTYFYDNPRAREPGLGAVQHRGQSDLFYDLTRDPESLKALSLAYATNPKTGIKNMPQRMTDLERMIYERGYAGVNFPASGAGMAFDPINVRPIGR